MMTLLRSGELFNIWRYFFDLSPTFPSPTHFILIMVLLSILAKFSRSPWAFRRSSFLWAIFKDYGFEGLVALIYLSRRPFFIFLRAFLQRPIPIPLQYIHSHTPFKRSTPLTLPSITSKDKDTLPLKNSHLITL